jgi:hypothetical protein
VSAEMWRGDVVKCAAGPPGSWVWPGQNGVIQDHSELELKFKPSNLTSDASNRF